MSWASAVRSKPVVAVARPAFTPHVVDWDRLVSLDFETYFDADYTLRKLSTSEYIRDKRFETLMCGIKIGRGKTEVVVGSQVKKYLAKIDWSTHALLCHHTQFDGFILSEHYSVRPRFLYCTLSMARGLHSNDIGAGLDEVSRYYGGRGKLESGTADFAGMRLAQLVADKLRYARAAKYCANDVEEMLRVFKAMLPSMPDDEMRTIDVTCRLFTEPVLQVDLERVKKEQAREQQEKEELLLSFIGTKAEVNKQLALAALTNQPKKFSGWTPRQIILEQARAKIASNESFAQLLRDEGITPPQKISPVWLTHRDDTRKWAYAFAKTDLEFTALSEHPNKRVRELVELRLSVKSTIDETRAGRLYQAGNHKNGLPVYLRYYGAHTGRWSGGNKMNLQNLRRGGELRKSIKAPPGYMLGVADSGQIEARVNAWLWDQLDLLENFRLADAGKDRDAYCKFADEVYGRKIVKGKDDLERHIGKTSILGLGYGMGPPKLQATLARGIGGPSVFMELDQCQAIVQLYRRKNAKIAAGWKICDRIIADMAAGRSGSHKCLSWSKEVLYLPNGMCLKYPGLKQKVKDDWVEWTYKRKDQEAKLYGAMLNENIVQALARIIVGKQMLEIAAKHRVTMMTHDEVVALISKHAAKAGLAFMLKCMRQPLDWCPTLPLNAEGAVDVIYSK